MAATESIDGDIMSTHVPDGNTPTANAQIHQLLDVLERKPAFRRQRGNLPGLAAYLYEVVRTNDSPAASRRYLEKLGIRGDVGQLAGLLAKLHRDDHHTALQALVSALEDPNYVFSGEIVPVSARASLAVCVPIPELTFALLEVLWRFNHTVIQDTCHRLETVFITLRKHIPDLKEQLENERRLMGARRYNAIRVLVRAWDKCTEHTPQRGQSILAKSKKGLFLSPGDVYPLSEPHVVAAIPVVEHECLLAINGFACYNLSTQGELLAELNSPTIDGLAIRREPIRSRVASWQFKPPSRFLKRHHHAFSIGFHPEDEHEEWKRKYPMFVSKGTNKGWGAMLLHPEAKGHYRNIFPRHDTSQTFRAIMHAPCAIHSNLAPERFDAF
jgi:hypothetical protein